MANRNSNNCIDWNNRWNYSLQWLQESEWARQVYMALCYRVNLAMEGRPYRNIYKEEVDSLLKGMDEDERSYLGAHCLSVPEGKSLVLAQSVNTIANQLASGVDTYECTINDPYNFVAPETADLLAAKCEEDYVENELELMAPLFSKDLQRYGMVGVVIKYNPKTEKNEILRLRPQNMWWDTMFSATGQERFRGYSTMIPWRELKKMIKDAGDEINTELRVPAVSNLSDDKKQVLKATYRDRKIRTLNDLDIYVDDINALATSPELQGYSTIFPEYLHDLGSCYNLGYYQTFAQDPKAATNSGYHGQDVELTVIYDLNRKIEFKIINRRFVISMNKKAFKRKIAFPVTNLITGEVNDRLEDVYLDCPLKVKFAEFDTMDKYPHPTSPVMKVLDEHNELCAWRAKRSHVSKLLATLRIETNGADADSLKKVINVMGAIIDDIQGDINSINFQYSYDPIDSQIAHLEDSIKKTLCAYTEFDAMQAMGDRASAAESGMAVGAIAQGLSTHQNIVMSLYADIAKQCLMNRVIYSPMQEFPVNNMGNYSSLTAQQLAVTSMITVKSKLSRKIHERMLASQALAILTSVVGQRASSELQGLLMEQALYGQVPRRVAAQGLGMAPPNQQEIALAQQQAMNQAEMLKQNQQLFEDNPMPYISDSVMQNNSPEEVDQIITGLSTPDGTEVTDETIAGSPELLDMGTQGLGLAMGDESGTPPELASSMANPDGGYYG